MKLLFILIIALASSTAFGKSVCHDDNRLFENGPVYECQTDMKKAKSGVICIETGYHRTVEQDGFLLRTPEEPNSSIKMFFEDPHWSACWVSRPLKGCIHEKAIIGERKLYGFRYRGPDLWDARSNESEFTYSHDTKKGALLIKSWGVNKKIKSDYHWSITNCQEI